MNKERREIPAEDLQKIQAALGEPHKVDDERAELQAKLQQMLLKDLTRREEKLEEEEARERARRKSMAESLQRTQEQREAFQNSCRHRRPDDSYATGGQYLSDGRLMVICQQCMKKWYDPAREGENQIIPEIMPKGDFIGSAVGLFR